MFSATRQLIGMLTEFEEAQTSGESPSPSQIRDLFRVRDEAKAEIDAAAQPDLRTEIEPAAAPAADEFNQDAAAPTPRSAEPSHQAEDSARVEAVADPLERVHESLQRAMRTDATPPRKASKAKPQPRKPARGRKVA